MLNNLKPVSNKHSITKVSATLFIPQETLKPQDLFDVFLKKGNLKKYQKKNLRRQKTIHLTNPNFDSSNKNKEEEKIIGFIFEEYDEDGSLVYILSLENRNQKQSIITLESKKYKNWDTFFQRLKLDLLILREGLNPYIEAISLNYKDEFIWASEEKIDVETIFNIDSELISKKFLNSINGSMILLSQESKKNTTENEERIEVSFSNRVKRISINHNIAKTITDYQLLGNLLQTDILSKKFNEAHDSNKKVLKDLLTSEVQSLIGLK